MSLGFLPRLERRVRCVLQDPSAPPRAQAAGMPVMRQHRAFPQSRLLDPNQSQRFDLKGNMPGLLLRLAPFQCRSLI